MALPGVGALGLLKAGSHRFALTDPFEKCGNFVLVFLFIFIWLQVRTEEQGHSHTGLVGLSSTCLCPRTGLGPLSSPGHCLLHSVLPASEGLWTVGESLAAPAGRESHQLPAVGLPWVSVEGFLLHWTHLQVIGAMRAWGGERCCCPIRGPRWVQHCVVAQSSVSSLQEQWCGK